MQAEQGEIQGAALLRVQRFSGALSGLGVCISHQKFFFFLSFSLLISLSIKSLPRANVINLDPKPDA